MTRKELREKAERLVADVQGWKEEDYKRPRHEVIKMHGGATFVSLVEAIESFGLEIARAVAEECANLVLCCEESICNNKKLASKIREYAKRLEGEK